MDQLVTEQDIWLLVIALLWTLPWKGVALWRSAKKNDKWWFVAVLVVNTFGLLEIVYIFFWEKLKLKKAIHKREKEK